MRRLLPLLAVCLALASCGPGAAEAQPVSSPPAAAASAQEEEAPKLDVSREKPADAMEKAAKACADLTAAMNVPPDNPFYPLTWEQTKTIMDRIAALGAPVTANGHDMMNYGQVEAFAEAVAQGKDAMTGIFIVSENGLTLCTLAQNGGTQMIQHTESNFPCQAVREDALEETTGIRLEGGYLVYGDPEAQSCGGYRVTPLGEENRRACRRYVEPVFQSAGGLMRADWDGDNLSGLDPQYAFETLYALDTGTALENAGYPQNASNFTYAVPGAEVRRILTRYLPVGEEWVRSLPGYDTAGDVYHWGCFAGGGYSPTPEVTDIRQNGDGTTTLAVNAVSVWSFGQVNDGQSELTLEIAADGSFRYLSHKAAEPPGQPAEIP